MDDNKLTRDELVNLIVALKDTITVEEIRVLLQITEEDK